MKLNDICSNERFIKGELYGKRASKNFYLNNMNGGLFWCNKQFLDYPFRSSTLTIYDATADDWKLYEFIDGKMVEYKDPNVYHKEYKQDGMHIIEEAAYVTRPIITPKQQANVFGYSIEFIYPPSDHSGETNEMLKEESADGEDIPQSVKEECKHKKVLAKLDKVICIDCKKEMPHPDNGLDYALIEVDGQPVSNPSEIPYSSDKKWFKCKNKTCPIMDTRNTPYPSHGYCEVCDNTEDVSKIETTKLQAPDYDSIDRKLIHNITRGIKHLVLDRETYEKLGHPVNASVKDDLNGFIDSKMETAECAHLHLNKIVRGMEMNYPIGYVVAPEYWCVECGKRFSHPEYLELEGRSHTMQPIEAMRWMRENPGKLIVAVEDDEIEFHWDTTIVDCKYQLGGPLDFFAYTYRIVEE